MHLLDSKLYFIHTGSPCIHTGIMVVYIHIVIYSALHGMPVWVYAGSVNMTAANLQAPECM